MKIAICLLSCATFFAVNARANPCHRLENIQSAMDATASNIANIHTTRTPEGGPYRKKEMTCFGESCQVVEVSSFVTVYLPDHVDADANGYVQFPDIDLQTEVNKMAGLKSEYEVAYTQCKI